MHPNPATILTEIKSFLKEAGEKALAIQQTAKRSEKEDNTIVTEADLAISALFQQRFSQYLSQPNHVLIDEETPNGNLEETLAADYQWIIDPIDGTATYAGNGLTWGIIISVFRKGEPWLGAVYLPDMGLMHWADETSAYETKHAFTAQEETRKLAPVSMAFSASSQVAIHYVSVPEVFAQIPCILVDFWGPLDTAAVIAGRLRGSIFNDAVWDFGASFVMATRLGYKIRRLTDGKEFTSFTAELLKPDFKLKTHMFMGTDAIYESLKPFFNRNLTALASNNLKLASGI